MPKILFFVNTDKTRDSYFRSFKRQARTGNITRYTRDFEIDYMNRWGTPIGAIDNSTKTIRIDLAGSHKRLGKHDMVKEICHILMHEVMHYAIGDETDLFTKNSEENRVLLSIGRYLGLTDYW